LPWAGTIAVRTLERFLRLHCREALKIKGVVGRSPYFLVVNLGKCNTVNLYHEIKSLSDRRINAIDLLGEEEAPKLQKYDEFIPTDLLRRAFASDQLDITALGSLINDW
jgi:ATP-dependent Lhr-like helicase